MATFNQPQVSADIIGDLLTESRKAALITFLTRELTPVVPTVMLADLVGTAPVVGQDSPALLAWNQAFTHQSVSGRNYERVETQGDAILKAQFIRYIGIALPSVLTPGQLTDFVAYYLSKTYLSRLGMARGMDRLVRVAPDLQEIAVDIVEDVFEAFVGTLFELGDRYGEARLGYPAGAILVGNYVTFLFNQIGLAADSVKSSAKGQLGIRASKFDNWKIFTFQFSQLGKQVQTYHYIARRSLGPEAANFFQPERIESLKELFQREGFDRDDPETNQKARKAADYYLIGSAAGDDKQSSEENSARDALNFLDSVGLTAAAADEAKRQRDYRIAGYQAVAEPIEAKYGDFFFRVKHLSNRRSLHMLMVNLADGSEYQLAHIIVPRSNSVKDTRLRLLSLAQVALGRPVPEIPKKTTTLGEVKGNESNRDLIKTENNRGGRGGRNRGGRGGRAPGGYPNQGYQGNPNQVGSGGYPNPGYQAGPGGYPNPNVGPGYQNFNQGQDFNPGYQPNFAQPYQGNPGYQGNQPYQGNQSYQGSNFNRGPPPNFPPGGDQGGYQDFIRPGPNYQGGNQGNPRQNRGPRRGGYQGNQGGYQGGAPRYQPNQNPSRETSQGHSYAQVSNSPPNNNFNGGVNYGYQGDRVARLLERPTTPPPIGSFQPVTPTQPPRDMM